MQQHCNEALDTDSGYKDMYVKIVCLPRRSEIQPHICLLTVRGSGCQSRLLLFPCADSIEACGTSMEKTRRYALYARLWLRDEFKPGSIPRISATVLLVEARKSQVIVKLSYSP